MKKRTLVAMMAAVTMTGSMLAGCGANEAKVASTPNVEKVADTKKEVVKAIKKDIAINVTADKGWDKDSTPAIAHIVFEDKKTDFYHAVKPDADGKKGTSTVKLEEGTYTVEFVSPLNKDGSAYEIYDTGKAQEIKVEADKDVAIDCLMKQIPADKVTDAMIKDIVEKTQDAVENGDDTLKGDNGKDVLETLDKNVQNAPNASDETKGKSEEVKKNTNTEKKGDSATQANDKLEKKESNGSVQTNNNTQSNSGNNGSAQSNNTQSSGSTQTINPAPAHIHTWVDHVATKQEWVSNIVTVPDYETRTYNVWVCNCGANIADDNQVEAHAVAHILAGEMDNGHDEIRTETVQVGSHMEDQGYYQTVSYVDYQYCACGATK